MLYEITTLTLRLGAVGAVVAGIEAHRKDAATRGRLLGCWTSDVGTLNRMILLGAFADAAEMGAERARLLAQEDPFGAGGGVVAMAFEAFAAFPWSEPLAPGAHGKVWEMRTYALKPGGLAPTIAAWEAAMPGRSRISPLAFVGHALEGAPRFTHFWPYDGFDDRFEKRARAVTEGVWPPVGGPQWLTGDMVSTLLLPTAISPWA